MKPSTHAKFFLGMLSFFVVLEIVDLIRAIHAHWHVSDSAHQSIIFTNPALIAMCAILYFNLRMRAKNENK